jgi:hypothetical protein
MSDLFVSRKELGVQNVHLNSGEDIIGRVTLNTNARTYSIENPVVPNIGQDAQTGNWRVGLLPLRPYLAKVKTVDVPETSVAYLVAVGEQMEKLYAQFVSDIVLAGPKDLNTLLKP